VTGYTLALLQRAQLYETNATETEQNEIKTNKRQRYYEPVAEPQILHLLPPSIRRASAWGRHKKEEKYLIYYMRDFPN
jgi:hypothetical protein